MTHNKTKVSWVTSTFDNDEWAVGGGGGGRKRPRPTRTPMTHRQPTSQREGVLWAEVHTPVSREDIAVHKKKVQEVEAWLVESLAAMQGRRIAVMTGPAGSGKTSTVRVLAREAGLNLLEWINPTSLSYQPFSLQQENTWIPGDSVVPSSQTAEFWSFLVRGSKYTSLCEENKKNLILVEDFPNAVLRDPYAFHTMLRNYSKRSNCSPVIFEVTDNAILRRLFPSSLLQELSIHTITFNPIASGLLVKALTLVLEKEGVSGAGGRARGQPPPSRAAIEALAESSGGDIRSAINALQFGAKKDMVTLEKLYHGPVKKERKGSSSSRCQSRDKTALHPSDSPAAVGGKDASLFLFRALGKVLYCKRQQGEAVREQLPPHLRCQERLPLHENPETIYQRAATGAGSLSLFLHQNCLPFFQDVEEASQALSSLAEADVLLAHWNSHRQLEECAGSVVVRGVMHPSVQTPAGLGFRPLSKPQWYTVIQKSMSNLLALQEEHFPSTHTTEELTTTLVPFQAKIAAAGNTGSMNLPCTRAVGLFSRPQKLAQERLGEQEVGGEEREEEEENSGAGFTVTAQQEHSATALCPTASPHQATHQELQEDFYIEEFPDS